MLAHAIQLRPADAAPKGCIICMHMYVEEHYRSSTGLLLLYKPAERLTEGAYSIWLPYSSAVTSNWQKCGCRLGPSWARALLMHSTTAAERTGLVEVLLAKRKVLLQDADADAAVVAAPW